MMIGLITGDMLKVEQNALMLMSLLRQECKALTPKARHKKRQSKNGVETYYGCLRAPLKIAFGFCQKSYWPCFLK